MSREIDTVIETIGFDKGRLKTDSRLVGPGDVFVAIKGTACDGHDFIPEALAKGAVKVVCEQRRTCSEGQEKIIVVPDARKALGEMATRLYGNPSNALKVYGVTGTNGKTTTVFLIDGILNAAGRGSGLVSTVFTKTSGDKVVRSSMTTPDLLSINRLLLEMISHGKKAAVLEISSHALDQERVFGVKLDSAVFTNITPEHLDYHGNMRSYLAAKSKIFKSLKQGGAAVLNADDPMVARLKEKAKVPVLMFGLGEEADVRGSDIRTFSGSTEFDIEAKDIGKIHVRSRLIGKHNVYNMLAAAAALSASGITIDQIKEGLEKAQPVPGRLDRVETAAPFTVLVDYAHTPNALENVLNCLRSIAEEKLICVFGAGGDRDRTKRPVMGRIATDICDRVILTSDNPRSEDPMDILNEIEKGVKDKTNYSIISNRKDAVKSAIEAAESGDVVVIAGKGHEDCQIVGDSVLHFNDKEVAAEILRGLGY